MQWAGASRTLKNEPAHVEFTGAQVFIANPIVNGAAITPHDASVVVRVYLKQQSPIKCPGRKNFASGIFVNTCVAAIKTIRDKLAFEFHRILDAVGMATESVTRGIRLVTGRVMIIEQESLLVLRKFWILMDRPGIW